MNSAAALKAFVGRHGGAVCTSTNARGVLEWALARGDKVLFFPDQHLGRNTGVAMGYGLDDMALWNPRRDLGGLAEREVKEATFLLWKGHCSIHQRFRPDNVAAFRAEHPGGIVIVHPEVPHETVATRRPGRLDRLHHQGRGRGARRLDDRRGHRGPPGQPARRRRTPTRRWSTSTRSCARARR